MSYLLFILATMVVLPIASVVVEIRRKEQPILELIGKWFIFWGVGIRLLVAGITQITNPGFTVDLLQSDENLYIIVQELGFTNLLLASVALLSVTKSNYRMLGTSGALFMGFAGILHFLKLSSAMAPKAVVALWSDLWICLIAIIYLVYRFTHQSEAHT